MKYFYWILKIGIFYSLLFPIQPLFKNYGWWPLVLGTAVWLAIDTKINKKLDKIKEEKILLKYPYLNRLKIGQTISVTLKNGKEFPDMTYYFHLGEEITVTDVAYGEVIEQYKSIHHIKLKKIQRLEMKEQ